MTDLPQEDLLALEKWESNWIISFHSQFTIFEAEQFNVYFSDLVIRHIYDTGTVIWQKYYSTCLI